MAVIGIDLGTTNSCVAVFQGGQAEVLENSEGSRTTPSVVALGEERLVGDIAKRQAATNPERTISSVKRFMGRKVSEVGEEEKIVPYALKEGSGGDVRIDLGEELVSPPEVSAVLLRKLKEDAEAKLGEEVEAAVVTVPAYFNDDQRQATKDAGRIAGLEIERIINEPTAAALAYGLDHREEQERILVFDLGGGTFDVSVLEISDGVFEVLATSGDNHLGGDNWDKALVDWLLGQFAQEHGVDISSDRGVLQRLYEAAEKAKRELSSTQSAHISLPFLSASPEGPLHLERDISRADFLRITDFLLRRIERPLRQALDDTEGEIDHVLLVGGMTRMPAVRDRLRQIVGKEPLGEVHPDEVVALGAAVQAAALRGQVRDVLLLDVTPLSLGIETRGGVVARLLERNTTIPSRVSETFSTAEDNQTEVEIHILQGESDMASLNKSLGCLLLQDIPPARRGEPQIEVEFDIDVDGILHVQAQDKASGRKQEIVVEGGSGLSEEEVREMISRAEANAEADRQARERAETHNLRESYLYAAESQLADTVDIPGAIRAELEADLQILRQAPLEEVPRRIEELRGKFLRLSQRGEDSL